MKRPQEHSKAKPRTSLAEMDSLRRDEIERLEKGARYRPSPYHKLHPHPDSKGAHPPILHLDLAETEASTEESAFEVRAQ